MSMEDRTAATGLDEIRDGGVKLLVMIRQRIREMEDFIETGQFDRAHDRAGEVYNKLSMLSHAEQAIGALCHTHIVRAKDIPVGATMNDGSLVVDREEKVCGTGITEHLHVTLKYDEGEYQGSGDQELLVRELPEA